jgi:hypothetical protein
MLLAWAALALSILSKGPVAILLTGGTIVLYSVWQRARAGEWATPWLWGGLGLVVALLVDSLVGYPLRLPLGSAWSRSKERFRLSLTPTLNRGVSWWPATMLMLPRPSRLRSSKSGL